MVQYRKIRWLSITIHYSPTIQMIRILLSTIDICWLIIISVISWSITRYPQFYPQFSLCHENRYTPNSNNSKPPIRTNLDFVAEARRAGVDVTLFLVRLRWGALRGLPQLYISYVFFKWIFSPCLLGKSWFKSTVFLMENPPRLNRLVIMSIINEPLRFQFASSVEEPEGISVSTGSTKE